MEIDKIDITAYVNHQVSEMEENIQYFLDLSKRELAIRLTCLENAVRHVSMADLVWQRWHDNIGYWEAKNGFIFEEENREESKKWDLILKTSDSDAKRVAS